MINFTNRTQETGSGLNDSLYNPHPRVIHLLLIVLMFGFVAVVAPARAGVVNEDFKLLANDGATGDEFGHSVAISDGIIAVGSPFDDDNGTDSGAAYLFNAYTGAQIAKLLPTDGSSGAEFGYCIAMSNGIVAVGARVDDENGTNAGAAYLFDASTGNQLYKLTPDNAQAGDEFGNSISIDNGIVAVGAWRADEYGDDSGAAYLFDAQTGNQLNKLLPDTGNNYQTFGVSIAIDAGIVAIGARTFFVLNEGYTFAKAYLFDVSTGNQLNVLQPDILNYNGDLGGHFADAIDIDNGLVAVGTPNRSVYYDYSGAAYVFDASTGEQLQFIYPADGHDRDHFGNSISIDNGVVAIGAYEDDDNGFSSGSAYLYDVHTGNEINKLLATDGAESDLFGASVAINEGAAVVGAKGQDAKGDNSGSAYIVYEIRTPSDMDDLILNTPEKYTLIRNYPNPFNPTTTISYSLSSGSSVELKIYNQLGQELRTLVNSWQPMGEYQIGWNGKDNLGRNLSNGIYIARLKTDKISSVTRMVLMK